MTPSAASVGVGTAFFAATALVRKNRPNCRSGNPARKQEKEGPSTHLFLGIIIETVFCHFTRLLCTNHFVTTARNYGTGISEYAKAWILAMKSLFSRSLRSRIGMSLRVHSL